MSTLLEGVYMNGVTGQYQSWHLHILRFGLFTLTIGLLSACGGGGSSSNKDTGTTYPVPTPITLESVGLEQDSTNEYQYFLMAYYSDDSSVDVTEDADWSVSDSNLATVDAGVITQLKAGSLTLTAVYEGVSSEVDIELPVLLESLQLSRDTTNFDQYYLTAHYNDDTSVEVTEEAEWSISDTSLATVELGLITALQSGSATLSASFEGETADMEIEHLVYVREIVATRTEFAALKNNGSVVSWPDDYFPVDVSFSDVSANLTSDVVEIYATAAAFAALKSDGSVITWGEVDYGGDNSAVSASLADNVVQIYPGTYAFAALKSDGSVVTWGGSRDGGDSSDVSVQLSSGVEEVYTRKGYSFAARKADGSAVSWGSRGGDSSAVSDEIASDVVMVFPARSAFAALKSDGSLVTWGNSGGDSSAVSTEISSDVVTVFSTNYAFAALKSDGSVVTWGDSSRGGDSSAVSAEISSDVVTVFSTDYAFAALKSDGSVVTWGDVDGGGDSSSVSDQLVGDVETVSASFYAFAALKSDGSVVTWGDSEYGGDSSEVSSELTGAVEVIQASPRGFAAITGNGAATTWGNCVADSSSVSDQLSNGVLTFTGTNWGGCAVLKDDKSVVTWGDSSRGGDSTDIDFY
ncbi:RCC1 domain-containing protein [Microbulbifer sp. ZKSA004]|uniref:RCC1 domain-containing protein n=1 Tax=Microbulbifer sp. ZKSA004 TaxID=3243389 RepID=UPI00403A2910